MAHIETCKWREKYPRCSIVMLILKFSDTVLFLTSQLIDIIIFWFKYTSLRYILSTSCLLVSKKMNLSAVIRQKTIIWYLSYIPKISKVFTRQKIIYKIPFRRNMSIYFIIIDIMIWRYKSTLNFEYLFSTKKLVDIFHKFVKSSK